MSQTSKKILILMIPLVLILLILPILVYLFFAQPYRISGRAMSPTLSPGTYFLSDKFSYLNQSPQRGEVIVYKRAGTEGMEFVHRIIGLPNEEIKLVDGKVSINGSLLIEPYLPVGVTTLPGEFLRPDQQYPIPADSYFVLGDNRDNSSDSRNHGPVSKNSIVGRYWFTYALGTNTL